MAAYHELVKNFEKVRAYMREFYVYGFKSRTEYDARSARSYDNERRRLESWLGDHMRFTQTPEGKNVFLSVDSRVTRKTRSTGRGSPRASPTGTSPCILRFSTFSMRRRSGKPFPSLSGRRTSSCPPG